MTVFSYQIGAIHCTILKGKICLSQYQKILITLYAKIGSSVLRMSLEVRCIPGRSTCSFFIEVGYYFQKVYFGEPYLWNHFVSRLLGIRVIFTQFRNFASIFWSSHTTDNNSKPKRTFQAYSHHSLNAMRKPVFGTSNQVRIKSVCSATKTGWPNRIVNKPDIILSKQQIIQKCWSDFAGWSAYLMFVYGINRFFFMT